jgi:Skp family chaperone for outer membrane proteins
MKNIFASLLMLLLLSGPALAADVGDNKPLKIAVIDLQAVLADSKAGKSIQAQLEKLRKDFQEEFQKQEEKLRTEDQELSKQREKMAAEDFTKKRREFEGKVAAMQRDAQEKRRQLEQAVGRATGELQGKVFQVVGKIAEDRNINLVLSRTQVFLAQKSFDITIDTIKNLDAQITSVPVSLKPVEKPAAASKTATPAPAAAAPAKK